MLLKSTMGTSIDYALSQAMHLEANLHGGRLEISNNLVDQPSAPSPAYSKNRLFIGGADADQRLSATHD